MSEVITLSDDDDIEILSPVPSAVLKPNSSANKDGSNQGATVHIATGSNISLDEISGVKIQTAAASKSKPVSYKNDELPTVELFSSMMSTRPRIPPQLAIRSGKRPSPGPVVQNSTKPSAPTQRTRNSHHATSNHQNYKGHYMFEATEGYEPSRRSTRFNTKKIEGKFVCSYNPTSCYKLCGGVVNFINHLWAHVVCDPPLGPAKKKDVSNGGSFPSIRNSPTVPFSNNSALTLLKMRTCEFCNVAFVNIFLKQQHVVKCHLSNESSEFNCNICEIDLENETGYEAHMRKHISGESPYHCQKCRYRTSVRKYFHEHFVDKHSSEALMCPFCLYQEDLRPSTRRSKHIFVRSFVDHMQLHATCQQFRCNACALSFNDRNELESHRTNHHTPLNNLWLVNERPELNEHEKPRISRRMKISSLQKRFLETPEGRRITDEVACPSNAERLGFDTTCSGNTLYKCDCGFNSWNGNRIASHFHKCRKSIQDIERDRDGVHCERDPEDELEIFAIYPQPTETEKETEKLQSIARQKLQLEKEELTTLRMVSYESEPIDDLLLLKMLSSSEDRSSEIVNECFKKIMMNDDD